MKLWTAGHRKSSNMFSDIPAMSEGVNRLLQAWAEEDTSRAGQLVHMRKDIDFTRSSVHTTFWRFFKIACVEQPNAAKTLLETWPEVLETIEPDDMSVFLRSLAIGGKTDMLVAITGMHPNLLTREGHLYTPIQYALNEGYTDTAVALTRVLTRCSHPEKYADFLIQLHRNLSGAFKTPNGLGVRQEIAQSLGAILPDVLGDKETLPGPLFAERLSGEAKLKTTRYL